MKNFKVTIIICLISFYSVNAQQYANHWYFGDSAGVDFSSGTPVAITSGMKAYEGCAAISDNSGNLLFYTNGRTIWNRNHVVMPNGTGLKGGGSSTQSVIIIPHVGNSNLYYVFTTDDFAEADGLCYSIVDMSMASGTGDVSVKNVLLTTPVAEKITAAKACNGKDMWVVAHGCNNDSFYSYLVSSTGLNTTPVISNVGPSHAGMGNFIGAMKVSPLGNQLALAANKTGFELYDFNSSTGVISNYVSFPPTIYVGAYGIEFSPDGSKLYGSVMALSNPSLFQFDLLAGSATAITGSATLVVSPPTGIVEMYGSLQLGPDKKIYVSRVGEQYLSVISNPNASGTACNYIANSISLGKTCQWGLPNFYYDFSPLPVLSSVDAKCNSVNNGAVSISINSAFPYYYSWQPSGATTSAVSNISVGTYTVSYTDGYGCIKDTFVTVNEPPLLIASVNSPSEICVGQTTTASINASGGTPSYNYLWQPGLMNSSAETLAPGSTTSYTVTVVDANGCTIAPFQFTLVVNPLPIVTINSNITIQRGENVQLTASGGTSYQWSPLTTLSCEACSDPIANPQATTTYSVIVKNEYGCESFASVVVSVEGIMCGEVYVPNAFSPNGDGQNDMFFLYANKDCISNFNFEIYDRWGEKIFTTTDLSKGWNGKINSGDAMQGTYVWKLNSTYVNSEQEHSSTGHINLIR